MHGLNPIRRPVSGDGETLQVQEIFPTLQGEGPYAGWPAVFIRLGGCNLACGFCDTEFESFTEWSRHDIVTRVKQFSLQQGRRTADLVVITGGEPMRQPIAALCETLLNSGYLVQIETNGTLYQPLPYGVDVICSPKPTNGRYYPIREDMLARVDALKFIVSAHVPGHQGVPEVGQASRQIPIYVQPMDEEDEAKNKANLTLAMQLAMQQGYRLSLQLHKWLQIP